MGFPWVTASFRAHPAALMWGPPWVARGQPDSPWATPQAAGESLFLCLEHFFPCPPPPPLTVMSSELYIFPLLPSAADAVVKDFFLPFLNLFPRGAASGYLWAWPWPAGNVCWRQLAQALSDMGVLKKTSVSSYKNFYTPMPTNTLPQTKYKH